MSTRSATEIEQEAVAWVALIDREGRAAAVNGGLDQWLAEDPRCAGALLQAEAVWRLMDRLNPADASLDDTVVSQGVPRLTSARSKPGRSRRWVFMAASGAGVAALAASGVAWFGGARGERIRTAVGEIRRVPLADGSTAAVNTASKLVVAVRRNKRSLRLEDGEAYFEVKKDETRPFTVDVGKVRVMAVGTAFSVRKLPEGAEVIVTEGVVAAWVIGAEGEKIQIPAGGRATVSETVAIKQQEIGDAEAARALAWRTGKIDFAGETLVEATAEFNRYSTRHIVIADAALARERVYGVFRVDDEEGFALAVQHTLNAPVAVEATEITIGAPTAKP